MSMPYDEWFSMSHPGRANAEPTDGSYPPDAKDEDSPYLLAQDWERDQVDALMRTEVTPTLLTTWSSPLPKYTCIGSNAGPYLKGAGSGIVTGIVSVSEPARSKDGGPAEWYRILGYRKNT